MSLINEFLGAFFQILFFTLIPFIVYLARKKKVKGFWNYIGLKRSTKEANILALFYSLLLATPLIVLAILNSEFREILHDPESVTGKFKIIGFSVSSLATLILIAFFKTSLAEEILFRGFIAKRLISVLGYRRGNSIQALIFGVIHTAMFATITSNLMFLVLIFIVPGLGAYLSVYLNEKKANGSIIPGWISHALSNVLAYSIIGFLI